MIVVFGLCQKPNQARLAIDVENVFRFYSRHVFDVFNVIYYYLKFFTSMRPATLSSVLIIRRLER